MTNREYMYTLTDEKLAEFIYNEPWDNYCLDLSFEWDISYVNALINWLCQERRGKGKENNE